MVQALELRLLNDNPAVADLLDFSDLVHPVVEALNADHLDPVSIGLHGPWGSGKSTLLQLIETEIAPDSGFIVVQVTPWEYDDATDVKELIIGDVLATIDAVLTGDQTWIEGAKARVASLAKRVSWSRVGIAVAKGAVTMAWNPAELLDAFSLMPEEPRSLAGFKEDFARLVCEIPDLKRVVVLVDDLDRCLPHTVVQTLEAIKLFLSVEKMVFVLACDKELVRDAVTAHLPSSNVSGRLASRYIDKLIQLPIHLPRLAPHDAEAYVALLLASKYLDEGAMTEALSHCRDQRRKGISPLLHGAALGENRDALLRLASQISRGIGGNRLANPREIKRFLNGFAIRRGIASARGIELQAEVLCKLLILEDRYPTALNALLKLPAGERAAFLTSWEDWATGAAASPPHDSLVDTKDWASSEPRLSDIDLTNYLTLAASFSDTQVLLELPEMVAAVLMMLLSESEVERREAQDELAALESDEASKLRVALFEEARRADNVDKHVAAAVALATHHPTETAAIVDALTELDPAVWTPAAVVEVGMSSVEPLRQLATEMASDERHQPDVRAAAREVTA